MPSILDMPFMENVEGDMRTTAASATPQPEHRSTSRSTILIVDDEQYVRQVTAKLLEDAGYRVLVATSGKDAIMTAQEHIGPIRLLLCDVVMWRDNCREIARQLTSVRPTMKVLYMSGYVGHATEFVLTPDCHFLAKPFSQNELLVKIQTVLDP